MQVLRTLFFHDVTCYAVFITNNHVQARRRTAPKDRYAVSVAEGRDKLTKFLIYLLKLIDALRSILRKRPTYRLERIASTRPSTQSTSKERGSSCGWGSSSSSTTKRWS